MCIRKFPECYPLVFPSFIQSPSICSLTVFLILKAHSATGRTKTVKTIPSFFGAWMSNQSQQRTKSTSASYYLHGPQWVGPNSCNQASEHLGDFICNCHKIRYNKKIKIQSRNMYDLINYQVPNKNMIKAVIKI